MKLFKKFIYESIVFIMTLAWFVYFFVGLAFVTEIETQRIITTIIFMLTAALLGLIFMWIEIAIRKLIDDYNQ